MAEEVTDLVSDPVQDAHESIHALDRLERQELQNGQGFVQVHGWNRDDTLEPGCPDGRVSGSRAARGRA